MRSPNGIPCGPACVQAVFALQFMPASELVDKVICKFEDGAPTFNLKNQLRRQRFFSMQRTKDVATERTRRIRIT